MSTWLLTLRSTNETLGSVETVETQFVLGTANASDVYTVTGAGVAPRHADFYSQHGGLHYRGFRLVRRAGP